AQDRLDSIEAENRARAAAQDRAAFDAAAAKDTVPAYRDYLAANPNGSFVDEAQDRIRRLTQDAAGEGERRAAAERETALGLNQATRLLVEQRLAAEDLNPGKVDGTFDQDTRRALRRFQSARGLN